MKSIDHTKINQKLHKQLFHLKQHKERVESELQEIKSSKAYKYWKIYQSLKRFLFRTRISQTSALKPQYQVIKMSEKIDKKKRIAFLTERLMTGFGVDLVVDQQASLLAKDFDVTVFAISIDPKFVKHKPYSITQIAVPLAFNPLKQDWLSFKYYFNNNLLFSEFETVVVHTPTFNSWLPFLQRQMKTIVYYYGNSPSSNYSGLKKIRKSILDLTENLLYFNFADEIASISSFLTGSLWSKHKKRTKVIHLAGDHIQSEFRLSTKSARQAIRQQFDISPTDKLITYIGRLDYHNNPYKNTQLLMRVANECGCPNSCKLIAIGFPENNIQEELYEAGVYSVANATAEELVAILEQSTVHISPSLWEGFNLPVLEAQSLGVPVVAYSVGAHNEVVDDKKSGYLVNSEDEFISKIKALLSDKKLRNSMSKNASTFASGMSWEKNVKEFSRLL